MGLLSSMTGIFTNKKLSFDSPEFIKDFEEKSNEMLELEGLLKFPGKYDSKLIENDLKLYKAGIIGERNVAYELMNSHMPVLVLHNLLLKYKELSAQIDYVVIGQKFILIIECKNMVGDIEINSNGEFIRYFKSSSGKCYKKEGMYSPITQNERHMELVRKILKDEGILKDSVIDRILIHKVVIANPKTIINSKYAKNEIKDKIIKLDQLINILRSFSNDKDVNNLSEDVMRKAGSLLLKYSSREYIPRADKYILGDYSEIISPNCKEKSDDKYETIIKETIIKSDEIEKDHNNDKSLYEKLKEYRYKKSVEEKVSAYIVYKNTVLDELVASKPKTMDELKKIKGFGDVKIEKYGEDIIRIICEDL